MSTHVFGNLPNISYSRTKINLPHSHDTSFNIGDLVPVDLVEVLPGDTFKSNSTYVLRTSTPFVKPIMGNLYAETRSFFVPSRILYKDFENVFGDPSTSAWVSNTRKSIPVFGDHETVSVGTVADHLGLPVGNNMSSLIGCSVLPFRAFAKIYNDWFRNENVIDETYIQSGIFDHTKEGLNNNDWSVNNYTGKLPKVSKAKDYFTTCLLAPQKGDPVTAPVSLLGDLPVIAGYGSNFDVASAYAAARGEVDPYNLKWTDSSLGTLTSGMVGIDSVLGPGQSYMDTYLYNLPSGTATIKSIIPDNLVVPGGVDNDALSLNINDLRFAVALQKRLEKDALYGTRYVEYLKSTYGVSNGDARLQRSEYLGGSRMPLNITQVVSTNGNSDGEDPTSLGTVGAYSITGSVHQDKFIKSFTEHGYIITVMYVRQIHTYSQGIDKLWLRSRREDFYDPLFAHLGEQPVFARQLCANTTDAQSDNEAVFGYQEAWAELRYLPNKLTGQMRPAEGNLGALWTIGDNYTNVPGLEKAFIEEPTTYLDNVLSAPSSTVDQFIVDIQHNTQAIRVMPLYSRPGLLDHDLA